MNPLHILKQYFGYDSFRDGQDKLVNSILSGKDTFGVMPTGAGKSICYQVPALMFQGITIVISPLISLMKDQVAALNDAGVHAAYINSSLSAKQVSLALSYAKEGRYKIIYVAPERLETEEFLDFAVQAGISMVTIDEAHCISQWGQDFRPSYLKIIRFIEELPVRPIVSAFTATATKEVREDIVCVLKLKNPTLVVTGFDRKNLYFEVRSPKDKNAEVVNYVEGHPANCGIIYCSTRKNVDELDELLKSRGIETAKYHAGMNDTERNRNQEDFIYDRKPVMIATNAFGMGIDKSNVRYVIHYNMPKNMESYYQEAGRAGRDGEEAECILLYGAKDVQINRFLIENGNENTEMTEVQRQMIQERDEERLKKMTYYCFTKDCLREYILKYFGQFGNNCCNYCSNCMTQFEEFDVTEASKDIIGCILESGQRFGINVIIATLLGSKAAKISANNMVNSSFYGKRAKESEKRLKDIINKLIIDDYLYLSNDKYYIVKVNNSAASVMKDETSVIMKLPKDSAVQEQANTKTTRRKSEILTSKGLELFEVLRKVRTDLAREEGMPPYIIFSDKTLTDMCLKLPLDKNEMMNVNGVGENKFNKYGRQFLDAIFDFTQGRKEKLSYESEEAGSSELKEKVTLQSQKLKRKKSEFYLTDDMKEKIKNVEFNNSILISQFVEKLNEIRAEESMKRLAAATVTSVLKEEGLLSEQYNPMLGKNMLKVTEKGLELGIEAVKRISEKGNEYEVMLYNEEAQKYLLSIVEKISDKD